MPELTITPPYVHSRVDSNTFTMGNPMPESTLTLYVYAKVDFIPPVRDFRFSRSCCKILSSGPGMSHRTVNPSELSPRSASTGDCYIALNPVALTSTCRAVNPGVVSPSSVKPGTES